MPSASQIGTGGAPRSPAAAQCTTTASAGDRHVTLVEPIVAALDAADVAEPDDVLDACAAGPAPTGRGSASAPWSGARPCRSAASRPPPRAAGTCRPAMAACAAASTVSATMPMKTAGSGWITARFSIHGSRGRTQQIASGSTPLPSSQTHASVAVLPEPTMTYCCAPSTDTSRWTGITVPGSAANGGGVVAGISRLEVVRVDHPPADPDLVLVAGHPGPDPTVTQVVAAREEGDLARPLQALHHPRRSRRRSPARSRVLGDPPRDRPAGGCRHRARVDATP